MGQISRFMLTADFDYHLPPELIASEPAVTDTTPDKPAKKKPVGRKPAGKPIP